MAAGAGPGTGRLVVDMDSFVGEVHGYAKQGATFGYTRQRGYHPLLATRADSGEVLHIRLRKGSANSARGALRFVDELIARVTRAGATGPKLLRADSGFWSNRIFERLQRAGWQYSIGVRMQPHVRAAIEQIPDSDWRALADYPDTGEAQIAETTLAGRRLIVRRTRLIGAQGELFPDWRHFAFVTNRTEPLVLVEAEHRQHAVVELAIRDLKDQALAHFPSGKFNANAAWTVIACLAHNLLRQTTHLLGRADEDLVDRHVTRSRDDVEDRVGDVLGAEDLVEAGRELVADLGADMADELALGRPRLDQRRAHVAAPDLLAQRFAEDADAVLGHLVDAAADADASARDRADVHEIRHPPWLALRGDQQVGEGGMGDVEQSLQVERDHPIPLLDGGVDDLPEQHHPGVVDHDVESSELLCGALDGADRLLAIGDVGLDGEAADLRGQRVEAVLATRGDGDGGALLSQRARRRLADPTARAGDERDRVLQCLGHGARFTAGRRPAMRRPMRTPRPATP